MNETVSIVIHQVPAANSSACTMGLLESYRVRLKMGSVSMSEKSRPAFLGLSRQPRSTPADRAE
jgi:hypothetical protein